MTWRLWLALLMFWSETAGAAPAFPWSSFRAIAQERPAGYIANCNPQNERTRIAELVIRQPRGFYRLWAALNGSEWMAIHYDGEAHPEWVWRGTWSGDALTVTRVSPYDPYTHASACDVLFESNL